MRPLVFVDCETTGLDPACHELIEIAALRVHPQTLAVESEVALKVRPERIEDADPEALRINGYSEDAWADAVSLDEAMAQLAPVLEGAMPAGHNVAFDRGFLDAAWTRVGHRPENLDHLQSHPRACQRSRRARRGRLSTPDHRPSSLARRDPFVGTARPIASPSPRPA